jgi:hypothetical protein
MAEAPAAGKVVVPTVVNPLDETVKAAIWFVVWFNTKKMPLVPALPLEVQLPVPTATHTCVVSDVAPLDAPVTVIE